MTHNPTSFAARALGALLAAAGVLACAAYAGATASRDLGPVPPASRVELALLLNYRNEAQLDRVLDNQADPASPWFGHHLNARQFSETFAPSTGDYARIIALLRRAGLTVTHVYANRTLIDAGGPAGAVERYFHTRLDRVSDGRRVGYAAETPASVPAELRPAVRDVAGFDSLERFHSAIRAGSQRPALAPVPTQSGVDPDTRIGKPLRGPYPSYPLGPLAFAEGYDLPVQHPIPGQPAGTTFDGTGRILSYVTDTDPSDSDLAIFLSYFKIARTGTTMRVQVDGGPGGDDTVGTALQYENMAALAPGAQIVIYEVPVLNDTQVLDAYNEAVSSNLPDVIDSGFSGCETSGTEPEAIAQIFKQGVAQGQIFPAASGSEGPVSPPCQNVSIGAPGDTPYSVAVGGTTLSVRDNGAYFGENYWDDSSLSAGGGGVSVVFALPKFQAGVPGISSAGRNTPDVAFDGDPDTGSAVVVGGSFFDLGAVGGTTLSSAIFTACAGEADQVAGGRFASLTARLYRNFVKKGYGTGKRPLAHDVTGGVALGPLVPGPGYDLATGIGSLDCYKSARALF
jgi:subtilase family serine protease